MEFNIFAVFVAIPVAVLTGVLVYFIRSAALETSEVDEETSTPPHAGTTYWAGVFVAGVVFLGAGFSKFAGFDWMLDRFEYWGYSRTFMLIVGATEFLGGLALFFPPFAKYAGSVLAVVMIGAIYTHLAAGATAVSLVPTAMLAILSFVVYENHAHPDRSFPGVD